ASESQPRLRFSPPPPPSAAALHGDLAPPNPWLPRRPGPRLPPSLRSAVVSPNPRRARRFASGIGSPGRHVVLIETSSFHLVEAGSRRRRNVTDGQPAWHKQVGRRSWVARRERKRA